MATSLLQCIATARAHLAEDILGKGMREQVFSNGWQLELRGELFGEGEPCSDWAALVVLLIGNARRLMDNLQRVLSSTAMHMWLRSEK